MRIEMSARTICPAQRAEQRGQPRVAIDCVAFPPAHQLDSTRRPAQHRQTLGAGGAE